MKRGTHVCLVTALLVLLAGFGASAEKGGDSEVAWIATEKKNNEVLFQAYCQNPGEEAATYRYKFSALRKDEKGNKSSSFLSGTIRLEPGQSQSVSSLILSLPVENVTLQVFQNNQKIAEKDLSSLQEI